MLDCAGKNNGATRSVLVNHVETKCAGKLMHCGQIGRIGTMLIGEILPAEKSGRATSGRKCGHSRLQRLAIAPPNDHAHFKSFSWIGWAEYLRALRRSAFASHESNFFHDFVPRDD